MRIAPRRLLTVFGVVTLGSFILAVWWATAYPAAAFYLLPPRAWELGAGAILAAWEIKQGVWLGPLSGFRQSKWVQELLAWLSLLLLTVAVIGFDGNTQFPIFVVILAVLGTAALISTERSWVNARLLSNRPMVFVGLISYSWYLWHWPLMSYLRIIVPTRPPLSVLVLVAAVSFAIAGLSWWFVEKPFRRGTPRPGPALLRYAAALAIALLLPITIKLGNGLPQRLSDQTKQIEAVVAAGVVLGGQCLTRFERKPNLSSECVSIVKDRPAVALIGDNHATALASGLRELTAQQNLGFRIFTQALCPPLLDVSVRSRKQPDLLESCASFMSETSSQLVSDASVKVVLLAGMWSVPLASDGSYRYVDYLSPEVSANGIDLLRTGLARMIAALTHAKKQIILVEDTPRWRFDPVRLELARSIPPREKLLQRLCADCIDLYDNHIGRINAHQDHIRIIGDMISELHGDIRYLDLFGRFCSEDGCVFEISNALLFFDNNHLSAMGSRYALEGIEFEKEMNASKAY
jgi:hypothetical protein